jgi:hypothetical protein
MRELQPQQPVQPLLLSNLPEIVAPQYEKGATLKQRFWAFHFQNPHIYQALRKMALDLKRRGVKRCGIKMLYENLRYNYTVQTRGEPYKLSNNFHAFYARLIMGTTPELNGFFELRKQPSQPDSE